jgi:hypothetical protein
VSTGRLLLTNYFINTGQARKLAGRIFQYLKPPTHAGNCVNAGSVIIVFLIFDPEVDI